MKIKESRNINKYLDLAGELKNLQNIIVMLLPTVIGVLGKLSKGLEKRMVKFEIRRRIWTKASLRLSRIYRKFLKT